MHAVRLALALTFAGLVWHGPTQASAIVAAASGNHATCGPSSVRQTVVRFLAGSNRRDRQILDVLIARDGMFQWFTIDDRDPGRSAGFYERGDLLRYLASRRCDARFSLRSFAFNGRSGPFGHFEFRLAVTSTSTSVRVLYDGKGAVTCSTPHRVAVWSMGNP